MIRRKLRVLPKDLGLVVLSLVVCGLLITACAQSNETVTPEAQAPATNERAAVSGQPSVGGQPSTGYPAPGSEGQPPAGGQPSNGYPAPGAEGQPPTGGQPGSPGGTDSARKRPDVGGQVTAVEGNIIRVENPRDGAATIVTDANTQFRLMGGTPGSLSDVAAGKFVGTFGQVQENGTIQATLVIVSDTPPNGGPGQDTGPGGSPGQGPGPGAGPGSDQ